MTGWTIMRRACAIALLTVLAPPGLRDISQVTLGAQNTCVRYGDGVAHCWIR